MIFDGLFWGRVRSALLIGTGIFVVVYTSVCSSHVIDLSVHVPNNDSERKRDRENEEATKRLGTDKEKPGDGAKAYEYDQEHRA